jgi:arylsulfatase A-like enzyme
VAPSAHILENRLEYRWRGSGSTRTSIHRRIGLNITTALVIATTLAACHSPADPASVPTDVILVTWDTTRVDRLSVYANAPATTPALAAFAREATVFERAYSTSSWTLPAHASMFTGKLPLGHGAHNNATGSMHLSQQISDQRFHLLRVNGLADEQTTLAEILSARDYATGAFVGGPWLAPRFGAMQGFATVDSAVDEIGGRRADVLTDRALEWLGGLPRERACFLFVNYFDPHWPYDPPEGYAELARGEAEAGPWDAYDGELRFVDTQFARLLDGLRSLGRYDDALVLVVSDHGDLFGEHDQTGHGDWLWEELIRVPFLVRYPRGLDAGRRRSEPVSVLDVPAIVAQTVPFSLPDDFTSQPPGERTEVFAEVYRLEFSVRLKGPELDRDLFTILRWPWKLILDSDGDAELYDLTADPGEQRNLAQHEPEKTQTLLTALEQMRSDVVAPVQSPVAVDDAMHEQLRGLGYLD